MVKGFCYREGPLKFSTGCPLCGRARGAGCAEEAKEAGVDVVTEQPRYGHEVFKAPETLEKGTKFDDGKAPIGTLFLDYFPRAIEAVAWVSEYGARKYSRGNWLKLDNGVERYDNGGARHRLKRVTEGEYDDSDSGLAHRAQKAWNALAELELAIREGLVEVRRGNDLMPDTKPLLGTARKI